MNPDTLDATGASAASGDAARVILSTLALSLLTPHVYLDTAPLFRKPAAWRLLDIMVGLTMWGIALNLIQSELAA